MNLVAPWLYSHYKNHAILLYISSEFNQNLSTGFWEKLLETLENVIIGYMFTYQRALAHEQIWIEYYYPL